MLNLKRKQKCRCRTDFINSFPKENHRCLWTSFGTKQVKLKRMNFHVHVNLIRAVRHFSLTTKDLIYSWPFVHCRLVFAGGWLMYVVVKDLDIYTLNTGKSFVHSKFVHLFIPHLVVVVVNCCFLLLELSAKTLRSLLGSLTFLFPTPFLYTVQVTELLTWIDNWVKAL